MSTQLFNIVRTFKRERTIIHYHVTKEFVDNTLPNLKRRARDNRSGVYFDAVPVPPEVIHVVAHAH